MSDRHSFKSRRSRAMNRWAAWTAGLGRPATGFVSQPEPKSIGSPARGRQLAEGNFLFAGFLVEAPDTPLWDLPMPEAAFEWELHGFAWLDDLAACGTRSAATRMREWTP